MHVSVFGCGYVGLVTGTCLAEVGNHVTCVDISAERLALLNAGEVPIYEPGLQRMLKNNVATGRLDFTDSAERCVVDSDVLFIGVGTPSQADGSADLKAVFAVADAIGCYMREPKLVVVKSTVPVGTTKAVKARIKAAQEKAGLSVSFDIAFNPEFLKEGAAIADFQRPDRIVIGVENQQAETVLRALYAPYNRNHEKLISMDIASAELTKYAANAMLATRISFMNEIAGIADTVGADIEQVRIGIGSDPRIGYPFLYAGAGFGGSCFPKDIRALAHTARETGAATRILDAVEAVNAAQKRRLFEHVYNYFSGDLTGKTIALWGLAFKPETDDMRDAPSRVLMQQLWDAGASVSAFDPKAMPATSDLYPDQIGSGQLTLVDEPYTALNDADALVVVTEWKNFWSPDFERIRDALNSAVVIDGRNIYDPANVTKAGLTHLAIGRAVNKL